MPCFIDGSSGFTRGLAKFLIRLEGFLGDLPRFVITSIPLFQTTRLDLLERLAGCRDFDTADGMRLVVTSIPPFLDYLIVFHCQDVDGTIVRRPETDLVFDDCILTRP